MDQAITTDGSGLEERVAKIENYLRSGASVRRGPQASQERTNTSISKKIETIAPIKKQKEVAGVKQEFWPKVVNNIKSQGKMGLYTNLMGTIAKEVDDMTIAIEFPKGINAFGKAILEQPENTKIISDMVSMEKGKEMHIRFIDSGNNEVNTKSNVNNIESFASGFDLPLNIIE